VVIPFLKTLRHAVFFPIQQLTMVGDADFYGCCNGRFIALELKSEGEEARPIQQYKLDQVKKTGGVAIVASPDNWAEVKELLSSLDRGDRK